MSLDLDDIKRFSNYENDMKREFICGIKRRLPWQLQPDRKILIGQRDYNIPSNRIETSKYNIFTFLPKNSLEQFSKSSNLYFLIIGILQILPQVTTTDGKPTVYLPLSFIMMVSMIKDFYEDYKRHKADEEENNRDIQCYNTRLGVFEYTNWRSILVGDIIKVNNKQLIPCDIIVLACSQKKGQCFIETKNLDGETNLKTKYAPASLSKIYIKSVSSEIPCDQQFFFQTKQKKSSILLEYERQNPLMYKFKGSFTVQQREIRQPREFLTHENFIERGCSVQNTDWLVGVVVYTGHDTKIMLNSTQGKMKYSRVEKSMGKQIIFVFFFLIAQCVYASAYYNLWYQSNSDVMQEYLNITNSDAESQPAYDFFLRIAMWFLLLSNCVPISLLVTLETVKFLQGLLVQYDENYKIDDRHAEVHSSNLSEELGIVDFVFSDKTGTLTCNIMKFKGLSVFGTKYGLETSLEQSQFKHVNQNSIEEQNPLRQVIIDLGSKPISENVDFSDQVFIDNLTAEVNGGKAILQPQQFDKRPISFVLILLSLCHTVVTENFKDSEGEDVAFSASSPDDLALVSFTKEIGGFQYQGKDDEQIMSIFIKQQNETLKFKLIQQIDFTSDRKRMSVIVQQIKDDGSQGPIMIFCKGADSVILNLLSSDHAENNKKKKILQETRRQLQEFSTMGLRTLVLGARIIDQESFKKWQQEYTRAMLIMDDENLRSSLMSQLEENIESDLDLIGATAIEDRLQDKVGEVINDLKEAGVGVWVLTGDKVETAINIGYSCRLLSEEMKQFLIDGDSEAKLERQLNKITQWQLQNQQENIIQPLSLVLSGQAFTIITHNKPYRDIFLKLAMKSKAVLACRVSPKQKQEIVALVKQYDPQKTTLAIGDGANDVSMITEAHVGVGIRGLEGQQAAKASDYAIGEFKMLRRLLFYTGQECYRRNSFLILFNFYKNQLYIATFFFYGFFNGFSGQYLYDQWLSQVFNLIFTSLPVILYALFDEQYPTSNYMELVHTKPNYLEKRPDLYNYYLKNPLFTMKSFWRWFIWGFIQSLLLLLICIFSTQQSSPFINGSMMSLIESGMIAFGVVIVISNFKILILHFTNYPITIFINILSTLSYLFTILITSSYTFFETYDLVWHLFQSPIYLLATLLILCLTSFIDIAFNRYADFMKATLENSRMEQQIELGIISRN